ncbi:hypothetical protein D3C86_2054310 [compost metagenome]
MVWTYWVEHADLAWSPSEDIIESLPDLSPGDADRKFVIGADQAILRVKRTENPLFARFPLILGSTDGYKGS